MYSFIGQPQQTSFMQPQNQTLPPPNNLMTGTMLTQVINTNLPNTQQNQVGNQNQITELNKHYYIQILQKFKTIDANNNNENLKKLINLLQLDYARNKQLIQKISTLPKNNTQIQNRSSQITIVQRCKNIRDKNQVITKYMLNLRQNLTKQMYMYKIKSPSKQQELAQISQRIRGIKQRVFQKLHEYKYKKINQSNSFKQKTNPKIKNSAVSISLKQLIQGTEVVQKQSLKNRNELAIVMNLITGKNNQI